MNGTRLSAVALALLIGAGARAAGLDVSSTRQGEDSWRLSVELPQVQVVETWIDGGLHHEFLVEGAGWIGRPGAPDLPSLQKLIGLPDASDARLVFLGGSSYEVDGLVPLPCQERMHSEAELPQPWLEDAGIYGADGFWPSQPWELGEPALMRNRRVVKAAFQPVQVNPVTGVARVWTRMDFELSYEAGSRINVRERALPVGGTSLDRLAGEMVFEPVGRDGAIEDLWFDRGPMPGKYVVFANTTALGSSYLQGLLEWKRRKGHEVVVVDNTQISFTASNIRNRIVTEYNSENPVAYVLLVGDTDGTYAIPSGGGQYDHYYAMIEGNDILGDVAVGRLPVDNASQLAGLSSKIVGYESDPYLADDGWLRRAGFTVGSSVCGLSMKILSRSIAAELVQRRGYTTIDTAFCAGSSHVDDWFFEGLSFYNYRGWVGMEGLNQGTVLALDQGPRTPVATIFTCGTGDFDGGDDYTEAFVNAGTAATPGGAVACMGFATLSTHTRYNNVMCGGYYGGLLEHDVPEIGACLLQGKYELYYTLPPSEQSNAENFANWGNLMGDPGTVQWAGVPAPMTAALPATLPLGATHLEVDALSGGSPVAGAVVCAYQPASGFQSTALCDESGHALLDLAGVQAGALQLTVTHHRHLPVLQSATVGQAAAELALQAFSSGGNARLRASADEAFSFTVRNSGSQTLTGLSATVSLDAADGVATHGALTLASLAPGASHVFTGVTLSAVDGLVDGSPTPVWIDVATAQGALHLMAALSAEGPWMTDNGVVFPGGVIDPGQSGVFRLNLGNGGSLAASGLDLQLVSEDLDRVTVVAGTATVGSLPAGGTVAVDLSIAVDGFELVGDSVPLRLDWTTSDGVAGSLPLAIAVGSASANDPTGPDGYGYFAIEDLDVGYLQTPVFDWYAISAGEGGPGTQVPLTDNGDEQDDGVWVDLPFAFTYYGASYTRAMICSNGFVSFDEGGFGEFDFRNHAFPTAMGPDAMIAPMWDDHESGGGGVWTWYDDGQQAFVVSWVNVPANSTGGPNSFQLVLYNPAVHETASGDGPFKFQYLDFNDTQSNNADFPHCSVGFKDHTSTVGLTLLNYTQFPSTMHAIVDGRAIYVSTRAGEFVDSLPPAIQIAALPPVFSGQAADIDASIADVSGVASADLHWRANAGAWTVVAMAPTGGTHYGATIPGQSAGALVEYYVSAVDGSEGANAGQSGILSYTPVTLLFADGFNGASDFTHEAGGGLTDQWHLESARVHEGSQAWKFGGAGSADYADNAGGTLTSPTIGIPAGSSGLRATWWSWMDAETSSFYPDSCYDGGYVEWSLDGGAWEQAEPDLSYGKALRSTSTLTAWFGYPRDLWSGAMDWELASLAVPDGVESLRLRFHFGSDQGTVREGWYLDDLAVTGVTPGAALEPVDDLAINVFGGAVTLTWSPAAGATSYTVYAGDNPYEPMSPLGSTGGTTFQVPALLQRQCYRVTSND